ncbi:MAG: hypothetical protein IKQ41_11675 [Clostridia bacterium]|nr:hypothetical protein [Clostridia bacterium]
MVQYRQVLSLWGCKKSSCIQCGGPKDIEKKYGMDKALAEQIARLYVTHPGVTADGIMGKMGR